MRKALSIFVASLMFIIAVLAVTFAVPPKVAYAQEGVAHTRQEFFDALARKTSVVLVDDIDFEGASINLNYDVYIKANGQNATLKNVYFNIAAPIVAPSSISITLENLTLDGGVDYSAYSFAEGKSFEDTFGDTRDSFRAINGEQGYFDLSLKGVKITRYASELGAALYVPNVHRDAPKSVYIENSTFENNISLQDVVHLSNDRLSVTIKNSEFASNYAYKSAGFSIANCIIDIDGANVHDNHFLPYDVNKNNLQLAGGGVFICGVNGSMRNSQIVGNHTVYGGGIAVSPKTTGSGEIILENVLIASNSATYGGGICAYSISGQPITFVGCKFFNNSATYGSSLYSVNYAHWVATNNGGVVEFLFCTFAENTASDKDSFRFYLADATKGELGFVSLKGCFVIGEDTYGSQPNDYNYIATRAQALSDYVVTEDMLASCIQNGLVPQKGSVADVKVPANVYSKWLDIFKDAKSDATIGAMPAEIPAKQVWVIPVAVVASVVGAALIALAVIVIVKKLRKEKAPVIIQPQDSHEPDERAKRIGTLTERELKVAQMIVGLKKRQEIANELNYSENTIKKDLSSIYQKLAVDGKSSLIALYKDLL